MAYFLSGLVVGLLIAGLIAINVWHRRNPMTIAEKVEHDDDMRTW